MAERLYPNITLFIEIAIFLAIFMILSKFLFKPVLMALALRKKKIEGDREEASKLKEETRIIVDKYEGKIKEAKSRAGMLVDDFKREGEQEGKRLVAQAKAENDRKFNESKQKIFEETQELKKDLGLAAEEVSKDLASKILQ